MYEEGIKTGLWEIPFNCATSDLKHIYYRVRIFEGRIFDLGENQEELTKGNRAIKEVKYP